MANVRLRCNMILIDTNGKVFMKEGSIVDLQRIPARFRKRKYIIREGEVDQIEEERKAQMAVAEGQISDVEELFEEKPSGSRISRR